MNIVYKVNGVRVDDHCLVSGRRFEKQKKSKNLGGAIITKTYTIEEILNDGVVLHADAKTHHQLNMEKKITSKIETDQVNAQDSNSDNAQNQSTVKNIVTKTEQESSPQTHDV